jgi:hypothetical protein
MLSIKDGLHRSKRLVGVVICNHNLLQTHGQGLLCQGFRAQASVTTNRVAMEVESTWTAPRSHSPEDGSEGMVLVALAA